MANPRRAAALPQQISGAFPPPSSSSPQSALASISLFLKKPQAFPFLLAAFVLLTWVSLRFQHRHASLPDPVSSTTDADADADAEANVVRFSSLDYPTWSHRDKRGWLLNPVQAAEEVRLNGAAQSCASAHVGEIRPGGVRGNHRHHTCNETFIIWGAKTKFRLENPRLEKGYADVVIGADEVAIAASPSGTAHAIVNIDNLRTAFLMGCQDRIVNYTNSETDFNIWKDF